jgi:hypothetical protein
MIMFVSVYMFIWFEIFPPPKFMLKLNFSATVLGGWWLSPEGSTLTRGIGDITKRLDETFVLFCSEDFCHVRHSVLPL